MKLTVGKKMSGGFAISFIISAITGGLILYWLTNLTSINQTVLNVHTPSTIEAERLLRYCGLTIGEVKGFLVSGDEKYIHDLEVAKSEILKSYKKLEGLSHDWILQEISKKLPDNAQESIAGLFDKNKQFIDQTKKVFEIKTENNHSDLTFVSEELSPLIDTIQGHIDQMGINMVKLLEAEIQTVLKIQKLL